jgi:hypothetical protein
MFFVTGDFREFPFHALRCIGTAAGLQVLSLTVKMDA